MKQSKRQYGLSASVYLDGKLDRLVEVLVTRESRSKSQVLRILVIEALVARGMLDEKEVVELKR